MRPLDTLGSELLFCAPQALLRFIALCTKATPLFMTEYALWKPHGAMQLIIDAANSGSGLQALNSYDRRRSARSVQVLGDAAAPGNRERLKLWCTRQGIDRLTETFAPPPQIAQGDHPAGVHVSLRRSSRRRCRG